MSKPDVICEECYVVGVWVNGDYVHHNLDDSHSVKPMGASVTSSRRPDMDMPSTSGRTESSKTDHLIGWAVLVAGLAGVIGLIWWIGSVIFTEEETVNHDWIDTTADTDSYEHRVRHTYVPDGRSCWAVSQRSKYIGASRAEQLEAGRLWKEHCEPVLFD